MEQQPSAIDQVAGRLTLKTAGYVAGVQGGVWALWVLWDYAPWSRFADQLQLPNISFLWDYAPWSRLADQLQLPNIGLQPVQVVIGAALSFLMIWVGGSIAWQSIKRQLFSMRSQENRTSAIDRVARKLTMKTSAYVASFQGGVWALWILWDYMPPSRFAFQLQLPNISILWNQLQLPNIGLQVVQVLIGISVSFLVIWIGGSIAWRSIKRQLLKSLSSSRRPSPQPSAFSFVANAQPTKLASGSAHGGDLIGNEANDQLNGAKGNDQTFGYADLDMRSGEKRNRRSWTIRKPLGIGLAAMVALFGGVGGWAAAFDIAGAVLGKGQVQASANRIAVQHPVGGVVAEILANNADKVKSGDVVLRLDDSSLRSDLATVEGELFEILANEARLQAEVDDRKELSLHPVLQEAAQNAPGLKPLLGRQQRQLEAHHDSLVTQVSLLQERINQIRDEASGIQAALDAKREGLAFAQNELAGALQNLERGIITKQIVVTLQKEVIVGKGEVASLTAKLAELKGKQAEQQLARYAIPLTMRALSADKLNLLKQQSNKLLETRNSILYKLGKLDVRVPVSGMVFDSKVLGPRSVIEAAKPIMYIVPDSQRTLIVVRVEARDIDQVRVGQEAGLRFTAFNRRATPIIEGRVTAVSADAFLDPVTQAYYYFVDVALTEGELRKLGTELIPGMPVEAFITTTGRSPASYAIKPIADYFARAFRD